MQVSFLRNPNGDSIVKVVPNLPRDKQTLSNEYGLKKPGDSVTLVRVNDPPTRDDPKPFHLESAPINIGAENVAREEAKKETPEETIEEEENE